MLTRYVLALAALSMLLLRRIFTKPPAGQLTLPSLADPAAAERDRTWAAALRALAAGP
jgi:hypothetical protein